MGRLVRRLRLTTYAPNIDDNGRVLPYQVPSAIKDNFICASACFLVYVGGAERLGQLLVLRRPGRERRPLPRSPRGGQGARRKAQSATR
jgi:hypothetical protein